MEILLALQIDSWREGKRWSSFRGRKSRGMEWIQSPVSSRAGLNCSKGDYPSGKALISLEVRGVKYSTRAEMGVGRSAPSSVMEALSFTVQEKERGMGHDYYYYYRSLRV